MITLGLDVGGTKVLGVAVDPAAPGRAVAEQRRPTPPGGGGLSEVLLELVDELAAAAGERPAAVGVGLPGLVDRAGTLVMGPHLPELRHLPLAAQLRDALGLPVVVDNDANCHAAAELHGGAAAGRAEVLVVTLGTGIGGGIITGGRLLQGAQGFAGEPGHMVVDPGGPPCPCGRQGCWERFASGSGLARLARDAAVGGRLALPVELAGAADAVRGEHVVEAARRGDTAARQLLDRFGWWVALGLSNLVQILDPELIVVGGGLVEAGELVLEPTRRHLEQLVMGAPDRPVPPVVAAQLGEDAGALGAAALAADLVVVPPPG